MKFRLAVFAFIILFSWPTNAELQHVGSDSITVGSLKLMLGLPEEQVLDSLGKSYNVESLKGSSSVWLVTNAHGDVVASVSFKDNKLKSIMKYWTPENQQDGVQFVENLYDLVNSFTNEGKSSCSISAGRQKESGYDGKAVFVTCGAKYIRIDLTKTTKIKTVGLSEVLE